MRSTLMMMAAAVVSLTACGSGTSLDGGGSDGGGVPVVPVVPGVPGPVGQVTVGNLYFRSAHNGSQNSAVDTVAVGDTVTWRWNAVGSHSIQSTGLPPEVFRNSVVMAAANDRYTMTFKTPGTYPYQCAVHGPAMTGTIVVQ